MLIVIRIRSLYLCRKQIEARKDKPAIVNINVGTTVKVFCPCSRTLPHRSTGLQIWLPNKMPRIAHAGLLAVEMRFCTRTF